MTELFVMNARTTTGVAAITPKASRTTNSSGLSSATYPVALL
jgi:hypothetical protein